MSNRLSQLIKAAPKYILITGSILLLALVMTLLWPELRPQFIDIETSEAGDEATNLSVDTSESGIAVDGADPVVTSVSERYPVYLAGAVVEPGIYYMSGNQILADAIALAGGLKVDAAADHVNLAMPLQPNQMIRIPTIEEVDSGNLPTQELLNPTTASAGDANQLININTATESELCELPGIGSATALAIIAWREEQGPFFAIEDIMQVSGIKEARFNQIKALICI